MSSGDRAANRRAATRILVVRLGSMGDILHVLPAAASLKHSFPNSELTWVVAPKWAPLLEGNAFIDRVLVFDRRSLKGLVRAWRELREVRFDLAVDFQGLMQSALVASAARTDRIYGYHRSQVRERAAALFYSNNVLTAQRHIVDQHLDMARAAGAGSALITFPLPPGVPEGLLPEGEFVLASPLAGWPAKQWPALYYDKLADRLYRELGVPLVVNGPPSALEALKAISSAQTHASGLEGLIHATRLAGAVVGVDSGPMHLAASLGKPGAALFGPTDPERNGPYGKTLTVLRAAGAVTSYERRQEIDESMWRITPDEVFEVLRAKLARRGMPAEHARS